MWAPADLYTPWANAVLHSLKGIATYFFRNPLVLAVILVAIVTVITLLGRLFASKRET